jgi:hypothetical protein
MSNINESPSTEESTNVEEITDTEEAEVRTKHQIPKFNLI